MIDSYKIRQEMSEKGWISHDSLTHMGWGPTKEKFGFSIWFERWDWHGTRCDIRCFHASTPDLIKIPETVKKAADLAQRAWDEFPDRLPYQTANGNLLPEFEDIQEIWCGTNENRI